MIDFYYWISSNAQKVMLFLGETGLEFKIVPVNVGAGEQFAPEFVKVSPNSKIPVITDRDPIAGGEPVTVFESGAILLYLAEKTGRFLSKDLRTRMATLQWLFWQVGGLGPMGGQAIHFRNYAPEPIDYALKRYGNENLRLIGVLDRQLRDREFIAGEYSIADMACYPWIVAHERRKQLDFEPFLNLARWFQTIGERPATARAYAWMTQVFGGELPKGQGDLSPEERKVLFGYQSV